MNTTIPNDTTITTKILSATYRFSTTVHHENPHLRKQYIREVWVSQLNFRNEETKFQLLCKKYRFKDPHTTPLIRKMAYVFDLLMLTIALDGRITTVENEKELQKKWERLKDELQKDHTGYPFENYLSSVDSTIYDTEKLIAFLESDKMYGMFFKGLWLYSDEEQMAPYRVQKTESTMELIKKTDSESQSEQYIFRDNVLTECLKINHHIQYEILCLGSKND